MANFATRIKDLTGFDADSSAKQTSVDDWLTAGARTVLNILPINKLLRIAKTDNFTNDIDVEGKKIISVLRKDAGNSNLHMPCRELPPSMMGKVNDANYMEKATASDPAYIIYTNVLNTFPVSASSNDSRLVSIDTSITVAYNSSSISDFPDEAEEAVVLYASRNALERLMNTLHSNSDIDNAFASVKQALEQAEADLDKMNGADESVFGDEDTFTTASSQLTRAKAALDQAENVVNNNQPDANTDAFGAQAAEDTELVASALAIVQTEIQRAQTHLAEWNSIGDMRIKQVNASLSESQGLIAEMTARLGKDQARYQWYTQQYAQIDARYKEQIQTLQGV